MSLFEVTLAEIESISPIEGADKVELATLKGFAFTFVVQKNNYKVGDKVFFFPEDSILDPLFVKAHGLEFLKKRGDQFVVTTQKIRGVYSNGVLLPLSISDVKPEGLVGTWTEYFGVRKYTEPEPEIRGNGKRLPQGVEPYDIESVGRNKDVFETRMSVNPFLLIEKIEGQYIGIHARRGGKVIVCSRNCSLGEESYYYKVAAKQGLVTLVQALIDTGAFTTITFSGELIGPGIQRNIYKLTEKRIILFDIKTDDKFWDIETFNSWCDAMSIERAPVVGFRDPDMFPDIWTAKEVQWLATDKSELADVWREGIVIRPVHDIYDEYHNRIILKHRSDKYLDLFEKGNVDYVANGE